MNNKQRQEILDNLPDPIPGIRGVSHDIAALKAELRDGLLIEPAGDRLSQHIASRLPHVNRILSYHPGGINQRAYYAQPKAIVFRDQFEAAHAEAEELVIRPWTLGVFYRTIRPGLRATYAFNGRRWKRLATYHLIKDPDLGKILRQRICCCSAHGIRIYRARDAAGDALWLVRGRGWIHHLERKAGDDPRKKIREAVRAERRKREADRQQAEMIAEAATRWVTFESSTRSGNCLPGTQDWATRHLPQGVEAIRGDYLLELEDSPRTRRVLAHAVAGGQN